MNIPTNKLKDLIATLQTFDQDVDHYYVAADVFETARDRRYLHLKYNQDTHVPITKLLDYLFVELTVDDYPIVEDVNTVKDFKAALIRHLSVLHKQIVDLENELDKLRKATGRTSS